MISIAEDGKRRLRYAVQNGRLSHVTLISGDLYVCKMLTDYAASLIFHKTESKVCDVPDYLHFDGSELRVESCEQMLGELNVIPTSGQRLISIANAGKMSDIVQNMLLKTIEEPPDGNYFFLYGNERALLPTILSRCSVLTLGNLSHEDVQNAILPLCANESDAAYIARLGGSIETAMRLCTDEQFMKFYSDCAEYMCSVGKSTPKWEKLKELAAYDAKTAAAVFDMVISDMQRIKLGTEPVYFTRQPENALIRSRADSLSDKQINSLAELLCDMHRKLSSNTPAKQTFDNFAAKTEQVIYYGRYE